MKFDKSKQHISQVCLCVEYLQVDEQHQLKHCKEVENCKNHKYYEIYYCPFLVRKLV
jgi:hypothetical protein